MYRWIQVYEEMWGREVLKMNEKLYGRAVG